MKEISSLLNYFVLEKNNNIIELLNQMMEDKILNEELYLNLVKALVLIFHLNQNNYNIYYNLFCHIIHKMNKTLRKNCFNKLKTLKLSKQLELSDTLIEDIIIFTHHYILNNTMKNKHMNQSTSVLDENYGHNNEEIKTIDKVLIDWINIICLIQQLKISFELKIYYYLYIIKHPVSTSDINTLINSINFFIKT